MGALPLPSTRAATRTTSIFGASSRCETKTMRYRSWGRAARPASRAPPTLRSDASRYRAPDATQSDVPRRSPVPVLRQASPAPRSEHRSRRASLARRGRLLGEPRDGLPPLQLAQGLENTRRGQHAPRASPFPSQMDDDRPDSLGQRVDVQGVGALPEGRELSSPVSIPGRGVIEAW